MEKTLATLSQSAIKKELTLEGTTQGVVLLSGSRIGQYLTEKGPGGHAVLVANLGKQYSNGRTVQAGRKEALVAALAKELHRHAHEVANDPQAVS